MTVERYDPTDPASIRRLHRAGLQEEISPKSYAEAIVNFLVRKGGTAPKSECVQECRRIFSSKWGPNDLKLVGRFKSTPKWRNNLAWGLVAFGPNKSNLVRTVKRGRRLYFILTNPEITPAEWLALPVERAKWRGKKRCKTCRRVAKLAVKVCKKCRTPFPKPKGRAHKLIDE